MERPKGEVEEPKKPKNKNKKKPKNHTQKLFLFYQANKKKIYKKIQIIKKGYMYVCMCE